MCVAPKVNAWTPAWTEEMYYVYESNTSNDSADKQMVSHVGELRCSSGEREKRKNTSHLIFKSLPNCDYQSITCALQSLCLMFLT